LETKDIFISQDVVFYEMVFPFLSNENGQFEIDRPIGAVRILDNTCLYYWCILEDPNGSTKIIEPIEQMELLIVSRKVESIEDFAQLASLL